MDDGKLDRETMKLAPNVHLVYLGDYVDRGPDSWGVLNMLTHLKSSNMGSVHLIRGNHEVLKMIKKEGRNIV